MRIAYLNTSLLLCYRDVYVVLASIVYIYANFSVVGKYFYNHIFSELAEAGGCSAIIVVDKMVAESL